MKTKDFESQEKNIPASKPKPKPEHKNKNPRHRAREFSMQSLYQWLLSGDSAQEIDLQMRAAPDFNKSDHTLFNAILYGVIQHAERLDQQIEPYLDRRVSELSPVEHAILLIGTFELIYHPEIPYRVVINEAVELSKTFGSVDGYKYVNGVLDKLAASLRNAEKPS